MRLSLRRQFWLLRAYVVSMLAFCRAQHGGLPAGCEAADHGEITVERINVVDANGTAHGDRQQGSDASRRHRRRKRSIGRGRKRASSSSTTKATKTAA